MGNRLGSAEAADAAGWIEAALEEWDVLVEAERAARRFVGHGDTEVESNTLSPTSGGRVSPPAVSVWCEVRAEALRSPDREPSSCW